MIRRYEESDAQFLAPIHTAVYPEDRLSPRAFHQYIATMGSFGGKAWVTCGPSPFGYALTVPVPGLPHIVDLKGCIAPDQQRRGNGTFLLQYLLRDLEETPTRQVSHQLHDLESAAARFLDRNGFYLEHEEIIMRRENLRILPALPQRENTAVANLPRSETVAAFADLFAASFSGLPWDQPYTLPEIEAALDQASDILFLLLNDRPIGFSWLRLQDDGTGIIEPFGILPAYQNQGYGRFLLLHTLHDLAGRGAARAQIGAWSTNLPAIYLYRSLGFTPHETISFLAYDLHSKAQNQPFTN